MIDLAMRIQSLRKERNWSQEQLGELVGVSRQAVSKWESGTAVPDVENCLAMSRAFGISIGVLLGEEPELSTGSAPAVEKKPKLPRWLIVLLSAAAAVILLAGVVWGYRQDVMVRLYDPASIAQDQLRQTEAFLTDKVWSPVSIDRETGTVQVELTRVPHVYWGGKGTFYLYSGGYSEAVIEAPAKWDGSRWTATAEVPLGEDYRVALYVSGWGFQYEYWVCSLEIGEIALSPQISWTQERHYNPFTGENVLDNGQLMFQFDKNGKWSEFWPEITDVRVEARVGEEVVAAPEVSDGYYSKLNVLSYSWHFDSMPYPPEGKTGKFTVTAFWKEDGVERSAVVYQMSNTETE